MSKDFKSLRIYDRSASVLTTKRKQRFFTQTHHTGSDKAETTKEATHNFATTFISAFIKCALRHSTTMLIPQIFCTAAQL